MTNYPCPPVGFKFTEENASVATTFYSTWLEFEALGNESLLVDWRSRFVGLGDLDNPNSLPWTVLSQGYIYTETPLPEGETE